MNSTAGVQFRLVPRSELTLGQKSGMFQLLSRHFAGVTPEQFARDLAEKNLALLLEREETFVGFSTLLAYTTAFERTDISGLITQTASIGWRAVSLDERNQWELGPAFLVDR